jgi:alkanesulfonate monooxygenase SsuD/methylene tetrahydromethanopterin reductase-like flavin-dependent oxidoreductase (luciferase family)
MEEGAASAGRTCDRQDWRVIRDIFVAETDAEAKQWVRSSHWAGMWLEQNLPLLKAFEWLPFVKHDPAVADDDVDIDYLIDNLWLVGSPETVAEKLLETHEVLGGFGTVIVNKYDYGETPDAYHRSLELLAHEVMPRVDRSLVQP